MAGAKIINILIIKVNKLFSFFSSRCFLNEKENMFSVFLSSYRNTRESLGELEKAFYDNSTNSRALIGEFLSSISGQTHEFIIYVMRRRTRADNFTICYLKKTNCCQFLMRLSCY